MKKRILALIGVLIALLVMGLSGVALTLSRSVAVHAASNACNNSNSPVVDANWNAIHALDSGSQGNAWAWDAFHRAVQVYQQAPTSFCVVVTDSGTFSTIYSESPQSPGGTGELAGGIGGTFSGGEVLLFTGTFLPSAQQGTLPTHDYACDATDPNAFHCAMHNTTWVSDFFSGVSAITQNPWGWTYVTPDNGAWTDASTGSRGDITSTETAVAARFENAAVAYTQTFGWAITKTVTPGALRLAAGAASDVTYLVTVTKDAGTTSAAFTGSIVVTNRSCPQLPALKLIVSEDEPCEAAPTQNLKIAVGVFAQGGGLALAAAPVDVSAMPVIAAGGTGSYPYTLTLTNPTAGTTYTVEATVTIDNDAGYIPGDDHCLSADNVTYHLCPFGLTQDTTNTLPTTPVPVHNAITVNDTNGQVWSFDQSASVTYAQHYACGQSKTYTDTATIAETGQSSTASVAVTCTGSSLTPTPTPPSGQPGLPQTGSDPSQH